MDGKLIIVLLFGCLFMLLIMSTFYTYLYEKKDQLKDQKIANHVAASRLAAQKQLILGEVKQKVQNQEYSSWQKASADLTTVFADETNHLRLTYPELTDIDICVLQLLAIGLDNQEILTFMDMTKRTFYKRRQLIAGRVGLLASQLDQFAYAHIK